MKSLSVVVLMLALALSGCAREQVRDTAKLDKAADVNSELGLRYMLQGKEDLALEKLQRALEQDPNSAKANHYIAELYRRLGEMDKADTHYKRAVALNDQDSALHNNYGVFLCEVQRYDEAEEQFLRVLKDPLYPSKAQVYENLGVCFEAKRDGGKAEAYYRQALAMGPPMPKSLLGLAELRYQAEDYLEGQKYLHRYLKVAPYTAAALWLGIRLERKLDNPKAVATYGGLLKSRFPNSREARQYELSEQSK